MHYQWHQWLTIIVFIVIVTVIYSFIVVMFFCLFLCTLFIYSAFCCQCVSINSVFNCKFKALILLTILRDICESVARFLCKQNSLYSILLIGELTSLRVRQPVGTRNIWKHCTSAGNFSLHIYRLTLGVTVYNALFCLQTTEKFSNSMLSLT